MAEDPRKNLVDAEDVRVRQERVEAVAASAALVHDVHERDGARQAREREEETRGEVGELDAARLRGGKTRERAFGGAHGGDAEGDAEYDLVDEERAEDPDLHEPKVTRDASGREVRETHGQAGGARDAGEEVRDATSKGDELHVTEPQGEELVALAEIAPEGGELTLAPVDDAVAEHATDEAPRDDSRDGALAREDTVGGRPDTEHDDQKHDRGKDVDEPVDEAHDERVGVHARLHTLPRRAEGVHGDRRAVDVRAVVPAAKLVEAVVEQTTTARVCGHGGASGPPHPVEARPRDARGVQADRGVDRSPAAPR